MKRKIIKPIINVNFSLLFSLSYDCSMIASFGQVFLILMDEEDSSDARSFTRGQPSRPLSHTPSASFNFAEVARMQLLHYGDIDQEDFLAEGENDQDNPNLMVDENPKNTYMKLHKSFVPIGPTYQAEIPERMSAATYLNRNAGYLRQLQQLKIHDPKQSSTFYQMHRNIINLAFGERTYEEICLIQKNYRDYPTQCTFQEYLGNQKIRNFWEDHFFEKKRLQIAKKKKKKKSKGSIPI